MSYCPDVDATHGHCLASQPKRTWSGSCSTGPSAPCAKHERIASIPFQSKRGKQAERRARRQRNLSKRYPIRAAKLLALAHQIEAQIEKGKYVDYADVARTHRLSRARLTQVMNLLLLAPDIQEAILVMEAEPGRHPISDRALRDVLRSPVWRDQRAAWTALQGTDGHH